MSNTSLLNILSLFYRNMMTINWKPFVLKLATWIVTRSWGQVNRLMFLRSWDHPGAVWITWVQRVMDDLGGSLGALFINELETTVNVGLGWISFRVLKLQHLLTTHGCYCWTFLHARWGKMLQSLVSSDIHQLCKPFNTQWAQGVPNSLLNSNMFKC